MPNVAIIGAALTNGAGHPWGLYQGGLDVIKDPGLTGLGVDPTSIEIREVGPGGVSSMSYVIDDPGNTISIVDGTEVQFWNLNANVCLFRGWIDHYERIPAYGGQGKAITVECTGVEAILDWTIVPPSFVLPFGSNSQYQVAILAQQYAPKLKAPFVGTGGGSMPPMTQNGNFDYPLGNLKRGAEPSFWTQSFSVLLSTSGGTLRNEINRIVASAGFMDLGTGVVTEVVNVFYTVDFYLGLRSWEDNGSLQPDDYTTLTVTDTYAGGPPSAAGLSATVDWSGVIRSVYVAGGNAAGSGYFGDGTGVYGPGTLLSDTAILTFSDAQTRAAGLLKQQAAEVRGTFVLEDFTPVTTVHAGSLVTITDAATGSSGTYRIMEIVKTFLNSQRQTWRVTFGGLPEASAARFVRRFTRSQLN